MGYLNNDGLSHLWGKIKEKLNNKVEKETGKSLISDTEIARLADVDNYDDTEVKGNITALQTGKVDTEDGKSLVSDTEITKLAGFSSAENYALKSDIVNVYKYKGSVATYAALPTDNLTVGDVYDVQESGMNYAWTGKTWDGLGEVFTITDITNSEIDAILAE